MKRQAFSSGEAGSTHQRNTLFFRPDPPAFVVSNLDCALKRTEQAFDGLQFAEMQMRSVHSIWAV